MPSTTLLNNPLLVRWLLHGAVLGGYTFLMLDIRYEHRSVVTETWQGWIPIGFSAFMLLIGPLSLWLFDKGGKFVIAAGYFISMAVGALGVWFHGEDKLLARLQELITVWQSFDEHAHHHPPMLAPLAFMGLGSIGLLLIAGLPGQPKGSPSER